MLSVFFLSLLIQSHMCPISMGVGLGYSCTKRGHRDQLCCCQSAMISCFWETRSDFCSWGLLPQSTSRSTWTSKLHASEASTWANQEFLWCLRRALCSQTMQLAQWFGTGPRWSRWAVPHHACLCELPWQAGMDSGLTSIAQPMVMWFLKLVQTKQRVDVPRSVPMAQPLISHGTKPPSTQVLCMERSGLTRDLPQIQHDHRKPAELQHPLCLLLAQLLLALPSSSGISVEVILWRAFMLADGNLALEMKEVTEVLLERAFLEHGRHLLHTKVSMACPGKDSPTKLTTSSGPATEICPHLHSWCLIVPSWRVYTPAIASALI